MWMLPNVDAMKGVPGLAPRQPQDAFGPLAGPLLQCASWDHILPLNLLITLPLNADFIAMGICARELDRSFVSCCVKALQRVQLCVLLFSESSGVMAEALATSFTVFSLAQQLGSFDKDTELWGVGPGTWTQGELRLLFYLFIPFPS